MEIFKQRPTHPNRNSTLLTVGQSGCCFAVPIIVVQGPRSNFEIGGGGTVSDSILGGGHKTPFRTTNIGEHVAPLLRGPCGSAVIFYSDVLHRVC